MNNICYNVEKSRKIAKIMKKCKVTITTSVDGQENTITRDGEMTLSMGEVTLVYREENGATRIHLQGESADIERIGDYTMRLGLKRGEWTDGEIGLGGSSGQIQSFTHRVQYSVTEYSVLALMRYDLLISGEVQKMQIRLTAKYV